MIYEFIFGSNVSIIQFCVRDYAYRNAWLLPYAYIKYIVLDNFRYSQKSASDWAITEYWFF